MKSESPAPWGLVLGSGAAKGWAHVGVIQELEDMGLRPDFVAGCSMGALVGGVYASGGLDDLYADAIDLNLASAFFHIFDLMPCRSGLVEGNSVRDFIRKHLKCSDFSDLEIPFRCVATDLQTGHCKSFSEGNLLEAIRASISIPGMFSPLYHEGRVLVDGGVTNPLPVDQVRAMGAERVLAIDLNHGNPGGGIRTAPTNLLEKIRTATRRKTEADPTSWISHVDEQLQKIQPAQLGWVKSMLAPDPLPHIFEVLDTSLMIMEQLITRQNLERSPADLILSPEVEDITIMEFHRAEEAIEAGASVVRANTEAIRQALEGHSDKENARG